MKELKCYTILYNNGESNEYEEESSSNKFFSSLEEARNFLRSREREEVYTGYKGEPVLFAYHYENDRLQCYSQIEGGWQPPEKDCLIINGIKCCCTNGEYEYISPATLLLSEDLCEKIKKGEL